MSIKGKAETISRFVGSILILISILVELCLNFLIVNNSLLNLTLIIIIIPPFTFSILLKVEQEFVVKNFTIFLFLLLLEIIILNTLIFGFYTATMTIKFYLISGSSLLLIICWHTSLSLYKNNKIIFFISGVGYFTVNKLVWLIGSVLPYLYIANLFLKLSIFFGILLIVIAELTMKKKGWLKYI